MRVGFYQFAPILFNVEDNVSRMCEVVENAKADILVFPELATCGYFFRSKDELLKVSEPVDGYSVRRLITASKKSGVYVIVGMPELVEDSKDEKGSKIYNSAVLLGPSGIVGVYRKVHLFNKEKLYFTAGNVGFPLFEIMGVKVGLLVCFDHLFPEAARTLALKGAQIICHPANLVLPELGQLTTRVRAIENKIYWILANRYGSEGEKEDSLVYTGRSQIVGPDGSVLINAPGNEDMLGIIDIEPKSALNKKIADLNDIFTDRKREYYEL